MSEEMRKEMSGIKSDVGNLQKDMGVLKNDVRVLKSDVGVIKSDVVNLSTVARNISMALSRLIGDIADMKRSMASKADISMLVKRMDGFADMLHDSRWDWGKQKVRLDEHEKRISTLEAKRA